ncbi:MAG: COQ9 family protein [Paracoccaceae bacterium]
MKNLNYNSKKEKVIKFAAEIATFDGWTDKTLFAAAKKLDISPKEAKLLFPRVGIDLARFYHQYQDRVFFKEFLQVDISNLSHFEKVELAIKMRFQAMAKNKEVLRKGMAIFVMPMHQIEGINLLWSTCDTIWFNIKDKSDGFTWYSKRVTLVSVYLSALLFFLGDQSIQSRETELFITRRLEDVKKFGMLKVDIGEFISRVISNTQ